MQHTVLSATLRGVEALPIQVEIDLCGGLPSFTTVGLAEAAVRESRVRVQAAITNSGFVFPVARITVNLAPAHLKKDGTGFDLPMALGILAAHGAIPGAALESVLAFGELSLTGDVRPVRGALAAAEAVRVARGKTLLVAPENAPEAALVHGIEVRAVKSLADAVGFCRGHADRAPVVVDSSASSTAPRALVPDMRDVKGQLMPRRALEIAAAGGHNLLFFGGPGAGKTMLARRLPGILPPLTREEALEVTRVHSVAGLNIGGGLVAQRPFRAPHHSTTPPGLVGGGSAMPRPGEVTLAHKGVLFLDELPEFHRATLDMLREPLEGGEVMLCRASGTLRYPAQVLLVASMNPCPCGRRGDPKRACRCSSQDVERYQARISGPLLDRIDIRVGVPPVDLAALDDDRPAESSAPIAARVAAARAIQAARYGSGVTNATATPAMIVEHARPEPDARRILAATVEKRGITARGYDRILRVARTVADLQGDARVEASAITVAVSLRDATFESGLRGEPAAAPVVGPP